MTEDRKDSGQKKQKTEDALKEVVALAKRRGFVFPGSEIYGGLSNTFDYGPYGVELMRNLKSEWWRAFVHNRSDVVGLDSSIMLHPEVWVASGHVNSFNDPLIDCKNCRARFRADQFAEEHLERSAANLGLEELTALFAEKNAELKCPSCGKSGTFTEPRQFNLMFSTRMGSLSGQDQQVYLRPETAQGIFINFRNVVDSCRVRVPFGVAQIGKSFRNEIIARQFIFRTREFEQLEMEFFCKPGTQKEWFEYWTNFCMDWLYGIGLSKENLRMRAHEESELSFYSEGTSDIEYQYPFGWGEIWGIASRTDYDLKQHAAHSRKNLEYTDPEDNSKYLPYVVEPALGLNRLLLAVLCDAYSVENPGTKEQRTVLRLHPRLAPVKAGIFPLQKKDGLPEIAQEIYNRLSTLFPVDLDISGHIGKRYYRQDELGTPFCITVDYETKENRTVTVRERDSTNQQRVAIDELPALLANKLSV
ncbi:MAG: glycine--tRNA ligase [Spirochaetales bacterium]|nr:glycine--tRNA ligase [Leptospiraceae bacterium]MCP5483204.1 glycine--tRNA ligase [Spirochaetales bacterium]MCP5486708.1 glycine--tRNA ligase [Spirochaetales bacterium]